MSDADRTAQAERRRAVQRLTEAVSQQRRLRDEHDAASDAPEEVTMRARLRVADDHVTARKRWLESVDEHDY